MSSRFVPIDALLLLMTLIWGTNYSLVKHAFGQIDAQAFNGGRMVISSFVFLLIIAVMQRLRGPSTDEEVAETPDGADSIASIFHTPAAVTRQDWIGLVGLGIVGHFLYQYCFIGGLALTSVSNSSLLLAATPVVIAIISAALGHDRIGPLHWVGAALSIGGIYLVIAARGGAVGGGSLRGDLMMFGAVCCWAIYTIWARQLMMRHSPVGVTGVSMTIGTALYIPAIWPHLRSVNWAAVSPATWGAMVYSALFALCVAYTIWYAAVRAIGSARTSVYSNLVPLVALLTAVAVMGEEMSPSKMASAALVLVGVALTRVGHTKIAIPAEE